MTRRAVRQALWSVDALLVVLAYTALLLWLPMLKTPKKRARVPSECPPFGCRTRQRQLVAIVSIFATWTEPFSKRPVTFTRCPTSPAKFCDPANA